MIVGELLMAAGQELLQRRLHGISGLLRRAFAVVGTTPMASMKSLSETSDKANPVPHFPRKSGESRA
jgi:hypothetical protein